VGQRDPRCRHQGRVSTAARVSSSKKFRYANSARPMSELGQKEKNSVRSKCLPGYPRKPTSLDAVDMSQRCHCTKSLRNIHAKTRKLWKHSAMRLAASRTNAAHQFTNRPLMNSVCPPGCPLHSPGLTCMRACTSPRAGAASTIEIATNI
jgi:hypothetical protein